MTPAQFEQQCRALAAASAGLPAPWAWAEPRRVLSPPPPGLRSLVVWPARRRATVRCAVCCAVRSPPLRGSFRSCVEVADPTTAFSYDARAILKQVTCTKQRAIVD